MNPTPVLATVALLATIAAFPAASAAPEAYVCDPSQFGAAGEIVCFVVDAAFTVVVIVLDGAFLVLGIVMDDVVNPTVEFAIERCGDLIGPQNCQVPPIFPPPQDDLLLA